MSMARKAILQLAANGEQTAFAPEDAPAAAEAEPEEGTTENNLNSGWMIPGAIGGLALLGGVIMWIGRKKKKGK